MSSYWRPDRCVLTLLTGLTLLCSADRQAGAANIAESRPYRVTTSPDSRDTHADSSGPERFTMINSWCRGELTDGVSGAGSLDDPRWALFRTGDPVMIMIDLGGMSTVDGVSIHALLGDLYDVRFPGRVEVRATTDCRGLSYARAVETFACDDNHWQKVADHSVARNQDGRSLRASRISIGFPPLAARQIQIEISDGQAAINRKRAFVAISEIEVFGTRPSALSACSAPAETGRDAQGRPRPFRLRLPPDGPGRHFNKFLFGAHANLTDPPWARRIVMADIIKDRPPGMRAEGARRMKAIGLNALRFYDAYWLNLRSRSEGAAVRNALENRHESAAPPGAAQRFPDYREIIDFCAENDLACVLVLDTIYYDPQSSRVYRTGEVADDADGVLALAAARNAAPIAEYYHQRGHQNRLILEIGNESIGYGNDRPSPSAAQYGRIVHAFAGAVKNTAPEVEVAVSEWPDVSIYESLKQDALLIDHAVVHPYGEWMSAPALQRYVLNNTAARLDAAGLRHVRILITEYGRWLGSAEARTYRDALIQSVAEISLAAHPRVAGMFEHSLFGSAKLIHSDGTLWSIRPSYGEKERPADRHPELGPRFAGLPSGMTGKLISDVLDGSLINHWPGANSPCAGLAAADGQSVRVLVVNPTPDAVPLTWPAAFQARTLDVLTSDAEHFSHESKQPWSIQSRNVAENPPEIPPFSMILVRGLPASH